MRRLWLAIIALGLIASACSCARETWQAVGYRDRANPEATELSLGRYASQEEARAAGIGFTKANPEKFDYIIISPAGKTSR